MEINYNENRNYQYRLEKMIRNYNTYGNLVIGIDFDFTLNDPVTKGTYKDMIDLIQQLNYHNFKICIWTANEDREYVESIWSRYNLNWHYYNYSPINPNVIKPHFNILLDDSAGLNESIMLTYDVLHFVEHNEIRNSMKLYKG